MKYAKDLRNGAYTNYYAFNDMLVSLCVSIINIPTIVDYTPSIAYVQLSKGLVSILKEITKDEYNKVYNEELASQDNFLNQ